MAAPGPDQPGRAGHRARPAAARRPRARCSEELLAQVAGAARPRRPHRDSVSAGRTLTQHAVPTTFGLHGRRAGCRAVLDVARRARTGASIAPGPGGRRGRHAGRGRRAVRRRSVAAAGRAVALADDLAPGWGCRPAPPWHGNRRPLTRVADILVAATDARDGSPTTCCCGPGRRSRSCRRAGGPGRGGSSTMPHKQNPVLSVLIRRAALVAPGLGASICTPRRPRPSTIVPTAVGTPSGRRCVRWPGRPSSRPGRPPSWSPTWSCTATGCGTSPPRPPTICWPSSGPSASTAGFTAGGNDPADYLGAVDLIIDATLDRAECPSTGSGRIGQGGSR